MGKIKAYNEEWLRNIAIQENAQKWNKNHLISNEQLAAIQQQYPQGFYRPNIFIKIGLFLFTILGCSFSSGFIGLFLSSLLTNFPSLWIAAISIVCGITFWIILENLIKQRKVLYAGVDNALLYSTVTAAIITLFFWNIDHPLLEIWLYCLIVLPIFILATLRYAEALVSITAYLLVLAIVVLLLMKIPIGKLILPFVVMIFAGISYWVTQKLIKQDKYFYYHSVLDLIEVLALSLFYFGGNYLIVREGNALINQLPSQQITFAPLFYFFSIGIPVLYIFFGLKRQDRKLLIIGLIAMAFSISTYRTYFSVLPIEWALTLGGFALIIVSIALIKYLHTPKHGITYQPQLANENLNLESMIITQVINNAPAPSQNDPDFGGGQYGGGGAGSEY